MSVVSTAPIAGAGTSSAAVAEFAMSSWYAFHVLPAAVSWSPIVFTDVGNTQPCPSAWSYAPVPVDTKSV